MRVMVPVRTVEMRMRMIVMVVGSRLVGMIAMTVVMLLVLLCLALLTRLRLLLDGGLGGLLRGA